VLGHVARTAIKEQPQRYGGRGLATAGLVTGYLSVAFFLLFFVLLLIPVDTEDTSPQQAAAAAPTQTVVAAVAEPKAEHPEPLALSTTQPEELPQAVAKPSEAAPPPSHERETRGPVAEESVDRDPIVAEASPAEPAETESWQLALTEGAWGTLGWFQRSLCWVASVLANERCHPPIEHAERFW